MSVDQKLDPSKGFGVSGDAARSSLPGHPNRAWQASAMRILEAEYNRSSDTHLHYFEQSRFPGVDIYLKDESIHPTGSLKHRLARSLILYGLCNGKIGPDTPLIEASSGSTAVSEAYFANLLGLRFVAVVPHGTSEKKLAEIAAHGGEVQQVQPSEIYHAAEQLAAEHGGYYLDQFTNAERATDWRSNNNIAESLFEQMALERFPVPSWVVVGAGTGGTSATIGRYIRYKASEFAETQVCVADPENSVFFDSYSSGEAALTRTVRSRIEGVGRPRVEPSFVASVVDRMLSVSDEASIAAMHWLRERTGRAFGPSTGLNMCAVLHLAAEMHEHSREGSIVSLICDSGERYFDTCYDAEWSAQAGLDIASWKSRFDEI